MIMLIRLSAKEVIYLYSKHARRHPDFDPTLLRQRRQATLATTTSDSEEMGSP